jgi:phosphopantothenoylcysteine decarboxylase / phosphopantothenate---cysteine ligase
MSVLKDKHILLGVTGSIAAFKAADLASKLTQAGAQVDVILTAAAEKFITPLTFQSLTGRRAYTDADLWGGEAHILHIGLARQADMVLIAPCTANTLSKLAYGAADNLLTITSLAATCPVMLAPAMDGGMFDAAPTQENVKILRERGVHIAGPAEGRFASGLSGTGRLLEPSELIGHVRLVLGRNGRLTNKKVVVTAGGTQEPLDPVRVLTNRSSGRQGYALAQAALDAGAEVTLISTPTALTPPVGVCLIEVQTAEQMFEKTLNEASTADALIMAAAVADFRPKQMAGNKMKKREGIPQIELEETRDILKAVSDARPASGHPRALVGFAAESRDLLANADEKLTSKHLDLIVANDISARDAGFGVDTNRITLLFPGGKREALPLISKADAAELVLSRVASLLGA